MVSSLQSLFHLALLIIPPCLPPESGLVVMANYIDYLFCAPEERTSWLPTTNYHDIFISVFQIRDILVRIPILGLMDPAPECALFVSDLQDANKNNFYMFFAYYFLKVHLHHSSQKKVIKMSQNSRNQGFSCFFCLIMGGSESSFGRPKNFRIQDTASWFYFIGKKPRFLTVIEDPLTGFWFGYI